MSDPCVKQLYEKAYSILQEWGYPDAIMWLSEVTGEDRKTFEYVVRMLPPDPLLGAVRDNEDDDDEEDDEDATTAEKIDISKKH